jgi:hypothetical protein
MPEELREPLSDAVMGFLVDEGMAKPRETLRWKHMPALFPAAAMSAGAAYVEPDPVGDRGAAAVNTGS